MKRQVTIRETSTHLHHKPHSPTWKLPLTYITNPTHLHGSINSHTSHKPDGSTLKSPAPVYRAACSIRRRTPSGPKCQCRALRDLQRSTPLKFPPWGPPLPSAFFRPCPSVAFFRSFSKEISNENPKTLRTAFETFWALHPK